MLIVYLFASLNPYILLSPTHSLVFCRCKCSSAIKYFSVFRNKSLHLHSTIDIPLIDPKLSWYSTVDCRLIRISDPIYISPTNPVPGLLLLSLFFCYQIFLWFSKHSLNFRPTIDRPLIDPWLPCSYAVYCLLIRISEPRSISFSHLPGTWYFSIVTYLLLSNIPLVRTPQFIDPLLILSQLIDPWLIFAHPGLLLLIVDNLPQITVINFINTNLQFSCKSLSGLTPFLIT